MKQKSLSPILTESEKLLSTDDKKSSQPNAHIPVNNKNSSELIITMDKSKCIIFILFQSIVFKDILISSKK